MRQIIIILALLLTASCNPYAAAWRTTGAVREAGTLVDKAIAEAAYAAQKRCVSKHGKDTGPYVDCVKGSGEWKALNQWRDKARPAINSALVATVTALTIAEHAKDKKFSWQLFLEIVKPAACGIARAVEQWKGFFGSKAQAIMIGVQAVKGLVCK